jgi:hypothetical protein
MVASLGLLAFTNLTYRDMDNICAPLKAGGVQEDNWGESRTPDYR